VEHAQIETREMKDFQDRGVAKQSLEVRGLDPLGGNLHHIGRAVARRQLHDAKSVPAQRQPHGLGIDRDRRDPVMRKVRQIATMQADGHCGFRLVPGATSHCPPSALFLILNSI
jgi:hypothetical protein